MKIRIILISFTLIASLSESTVFDIHNITCNYSDKVRVIKFDQLNEWKFNCDQFQTATYLIFLANNPIILTRSIDIGYLKLSTDIRLVNFNGFEINIYLLKDYTLSAIDKVYFEFIKFEFYNNGSRITSVCDKQRELSIFSLFYFPLVKKFYFKKTVIYSSNVCPYIFDQSHLTNVLFEHLSSSFFRKNRLRFLKLNPNSTQIYSRIETIEFSLFNFIISTELLNEDVSMMTSSIKLSGNINYIDKLTFKNFENLKILHLDFNDIKRFIYRSTEWMEYLNFNIISERPFETFLYNNT